MTEFYEGEPLDWIDQTANALEQMGEHISNILSHGLTITFAASAMLAAHNVINSRPNIVNTVFLGGSALLAARRTLSS